MKNTRMIVVALVVLCLTVVYPLFNAMTEEQRQQRSPEEMKALMQVMLKARIEVYASPDITETLSKFYRNLYQALIASGFTKEEALQIVISQGNILGGGKK